MAAKKDKYDKLHDKELAALLRELDAIYADLANEIGSIGATYASSVDKSVPFVLSKYPLIQKRVDAVLKKLAKRVKTSVVDGAKSAWTLANQKNNELCRLVFGAMLGQLTKEQERKYYASNDNALQAFLQRKVKGMNLSDRVWNYSDMCKHQIEATLELGIKTGESAAEMATDLKTYLKYPDKLFRRVRGADGNLHLSKAAAQFHPGQGVYRSSYQNAYRLARTETNIAYRSADYLRRTQLDFVVGIEIHLSNNHTCLGRDGKPHPFTDICDELKGKYPKWFDFKGWHPACRCFTTSILKTDEEIERDMDGIDRGSVNEVKDMPPQWTKWLEKNQERVDMSAALGKLPYFIKDNPWAWQEGVEPPWVEYQKAQQQQAQKQTILQRAQARHAARTPEQIADIKRRWNQRQIAYNNAKMVLKLVDSVPDLYQFWSHHDSYYSNMVNRVRKMYETGQGYKSYGGMGLDLYEILDEIKRMRDKLGCLADPFKAMQDHGIEKARAANAAVEQKLLSFNSKGDLDWKIKKLKFEIDWLDKPENQKYSTWKVAQDAYRKALEEAELQKFWYDFEVGGNSVGYYMGKAKIKYPNIYGRMRVAYKSKDKSAMSDLAVELALEEKWEENRNKFEHIKNTYPIAYKLEQNNDQFTFMTDMEYAIANRLSLKFKKAYDAATQAIGTYNGYKVTVSDLLDELLVHNLDGSETEQKLVSALAKANLDELAEAIKEAKWAVKWAKLKEEYMSYKTNINAGMLDAKNKLGYLDAMKKAIDDQEEYPYNIAKKNLDAAISKFNTCVNEAIKLIARLNAVGENQAALDLEKTVDTYVFTDIADALKKAEELATWAELKKRADEILKPVNRTTLEKLGQKSLVDAVETYLSVKDAAWLKSALDKAEQALKSWHDLVTESIGWALKPLPQAIIDELSDAVRAVDFHRLMNAIQRAQNYENVFGPMKKELTDLEGQKSDLQKELVDRKAELKKKRADIAARRKKVKDDEDRIIAMFPNLTVEWLKKNSSEFVAAEEERKKVNEDAKKLRDAEAKLADATDKFDKWDDAVTNAQLYIEQEDKKQARLFIDILSGIASDIRKLSGTDQSDWDASTYTQARKDAAFWAKVDPSKGIHDSQDAMRAADGVLRKKAGEAWNAATDEQKDAIYAYTSSYHNIQEPLRGVTYYGSSSSTSAGLARIPRITEIIESSSYDFDMWVQRFDDKMSLMKFGINPYQPITDDMMNALVGKTGTEGAFWSAGCAKGGGYKAGRNITYNIYCPRGTKMMYIEPISACGNGDGRYWDGKSSQRTFGSEIEALIQRGTTFRVLKVEKVGSGSFDSCAWFIDVEIIAQKPLPFPYAGGKYPYTKFDP